MPAMLMPKAVHPHACGERRGHDNNVHDKTGSSPRLWGTEPLKAEQLLDMRFIPTPVGNGTDSGQTSTPTPVHPHACGERTVRMTYAAELDGSSPRLWGTAADMPTCSAYARFIPTPVGNGLV